MGAPFGDYFLKWICQVFPLSFIYVSWKALYTVHAYTEEL